MSERRSCPHDPSPRPSRTGCSVNGREHTVASSWLGESLLYVLRERLGLPAPRTAASRGSAAPAPCWSTAALSAPAACWRPTPSCRHPHRRGPGGRGPAARRSRRPAGLPRCRRGAVRLLHARPGGGRARPAGPPPRRRRPRGPRGARGQPVPLHRLRACPGGGRAAFATNAGRVGRRLGRGGRRAAGRGGDAAPPRRRVPRPPPRPRRTPRGRRLGDSADRPDGGRQGHRQLRVLADLPSRACCGAAPCAARTPRPGSGPSTRRARPRCRACTPWSLAEDVPGSRPVRHGAPRPAGVRLRGRPLPRRADRGGRRRPPRTARRAAAAIVVDYEVLEPLARPRGGHHGRPAASRRQHLPPHRAAPRRPGRRDRRGRGRGHLRGRPCRTRPSSAPRPAWPSPPATAASTCTSPPSGCTSTATRSPRASACRPTRCACPWRASGGAFGGREDVGLQVHVCLLALVTGRPVKMLYSP